MEHRNGTCWLDVDGNPIQAHGGMIARFGDTWYWYGENKDAENCQRNGLPLSRVDVVGVSCYSSPDLLHWKHEGVVLPAVPGDPSHPLHPDRVLERPKVFFNAHTGKYVLWFHADSADYTFAQAGCAVADSPVGPFRFVRTAPPNRRDCRDMTLYHDPVSGSEFLVHSGDWNKTLYFSELTPDGLDFTGRCFAQMINQEREAPALCYHGGLHYCVTSGCTGWQPNSALYATCRELCMDMKLIDNPCEGPGYRQTFGGQSTWILQDGDRYWLMLDHWKPLELRRSGYSLLPMTFDGDRLTVRWQDTFTGIG